MTMQYNTGCKGAVKTDNGNILNVSSRVIQGRDFNAIMDHVYILSDSLRMRFLPNNNNNNNNNNNSNLNESRMNTVRL